MTVPCKNRRFCLPVSQSARQCWPNRVGMATNIPPHNLGEVIRAALAYIDNPAITIDELIEIVPAPISADGTFDFLGQGGARSAYREWGRWCCGDMKSKRDVLTGNRSFLPVFPFKSASPVWLKKSLRQQKTSVLKAFRNIADEFQSKRVSALLTS